MAAAYEWEHEPKVKGLHSGSALPDSLGAVRLQDQAVLYLRVAAEAVSPHRLLSYWTGDHLLLAPRSPDSRGS